MSGADLRKEAYSLLILKKSLQKQIKELETMLIEETEDADDDQIHAEVMKSIDHLETVILNKGVELMCQEKALKGAEMNWAICKHLGLDSSVEMQVGASPAEKAKQTSALALILKNNAAQTKYIGVLKEIEHLQEQVVEKQHQSLELIVEARQMRQKFVNLEKQNEISQEEANTESRLEGLLQENMQTYRMVAAMFQELIFCSNVDYHQNPDLRSLVLSLAKELELEK